MTRVAASTDPGSEFHAFLFATIGEDRNGVPLSVISALARMDIDPWDEAAVLARLPDKAMADRMVALFSGVPDQTLTDRDRDAMANRLSVLLPRPSTAGITVPASSPRSNDEAQSRFGALLFSLFIFALMTTQFVMARIQPRTRGNPAAATAVIAKPAPPVLAPSGQ